jgi:hypothetical protein
MARNDGFELEVPLHGRAATSGPMVNRSPIGTMAIAG